MRLKFLKSTRRGTDVLANRSVDSHRSRTDPSTLNMSGFLAPDPREAIAVSALQKNVGSILGRSPDFEYSTKLERNRRFSILKTSTLTLVIIIEPLFSSSLSLGSEQNLVSFILTTFVSMVNYRTRIRAHTQEALGRCFCEACRVERDVGVLGGWIGVMVLWCSPGAIISYH